MLSNTSATIFNRSVDSQSGAVTYTKTVIPAVHWEDSTSAVQNKTSNTKRKSAFILIPYSVRNRIKKKYVLPEAYAKLPPKDRQRRWTVGIGDILVKGSSCEVIPDREFRQWMINHPEAAIISKVDTLDLGRLKHWEVYTE